MTSTGGAKWDLTREVIINGDGKVGIGTQPSESFHVDSNALFDGTATTTPHVRIAAEGSTDLLQVIDGAASTNRVAFVVKNGGKVGIGTGDPSTTLTVSGSISAQGSIYAGNNSFIFADGSSISTTTLSAFNAAHTTMQAKSADWQAVQSSYHSNSAYWDQTLTTVRANSSNDLTGWTGFNIVSAYGRTGSSSVHAANRSQVLSISGQGGVDVYQTSNTIVISSAPTVAGATNAKATAAYTTTHDNSATWTTGANLANAHNVRWISTYNTLSANSGNWDTTYTRVASAHNEWDKTTTTLRANSASWTLSAAAGGWTDDGTVVRLSTASNKVGIGTTAPNQALTIAGGISARDIIYAGATQYPSSNSLEWESTHTTVNGTSSNWETTYTRVASAHNEWDKTNTTVRANSAAWALSASSGWTADSDTNTVHTLNSLSSVGIGTSTPPEKLTVVGNISANGTVYSDSGNSTEWESTHTDVTANSSNWNSVYDALSADSKNLDIKNGTFFIDKDTGYIGMGTNSPAQKLEIVGNLAVNTIKTRSGASQALRLESNGSLLLTGDADNNNSSADIKIYTNGESASNLKLTIQDGGNVGIGSSSPGKKLTVAGDISARDIIYAGATQYPSSNSLEWGASHTTVNSNSSRWESVYTTYASDSADLIVGFNYVAKSAGVSAVKLTASQIYDTGQTVGIGAGEISDIDPLAAIPTKLVVGGALSAQGLKTNGLSGMTTTVTLCGGVGIMQFTNGILTSIT